MGENNNKLNNWQRVNFQNIQAAHTTQYQKKNKATQSKSEQKTWTDICVKKTHRWLINTWKNAQHHSLLENANQTTMRYHLTPIGIIIKNPQTTSAAEGLEKKNPLVLLVEM